MKKYIMTKERIRVIELKDKNIRLLYKAYLLKCLSNNIDEKIDNPPVSYKVFKKQLKKEQKNGIINK